MKRFIKEYIPKLTERKKRKEKRKNLKEGNVVLVAEPNVGDIEALTPNHFLLPRANPSNEEADVSEREINSTKLWRQFQALVNFFWKRFIKE